MIVYENIHNVCVVAGCTEGVQIYVYVVAGSTEAEHNLR